MTTNAQLIIESLKKHTGINFIQHQVEDTVFFSGHFQLTEVGVYTFDVVRFVEDSDTGAENEFSLGEDLTLADVIDAINKERGVK